MSRIKLMFFKLVDVHFGLQILDLFFGRLLRFYLPHEEKNICSLEVSVNFINLNLVKPEHGIFSGD